MYLISCGKFFEFFIESSKNIQTYFLLDYHGMIISTNNSHPQNSFLHLVRSNDFFPKLLIIHQVILSLSIFIINVLHFIKYYMQKGLFLYHIVCGRHLMFSSLFLLRNSHSTFHQVLVQLPNILQTPSLGIRIYTHYSQSPITILQSLVPRN